MADVLVEFVAEGVDLLQDTKSIDRNRVGLKLQLRGNLGTGAIPQQPGASVRALVFRKRYERWANSRTCRLSLPASDRVLSELVAAGQSWVWVFLIQPSPGISSRGPRATG